jgi:hypothetical protein
MPLPPQPTGAAYDREVAQIIHALRQRGISSRSELGRAVGASRWGPGRFGSALRIAQQPGQARRVARARYEAVEAAKRDEATAGGADSPALPARNRSGSNRLEPAGEPDRWAAPSTNRGATTPARRPQGQSGG